MNGASEKRMQDRITKILRLMVTHGDNRYCFECRHRGPTYVDMTIGSFICTSCGGAVRKYSHRIKSFSMSNFSPAEIEFLCKRGNKACKKIYLAVDDKSAAEIDVKANLDDYLRLKYQVKKWYRDPTSDVEAEAIAENQEIMNRAEQTETQKQNTGPGVNATAGLIIAPPPRPPPEHTNTAISRNHVNPVSAVNNHSGNLFLDEKIHAGDTLQSERDKTLSDVFNGFNDDLFNPPLNMLSSHPSTTFHDPFSSTSGGFGGSTFAPTGWNLPQTTQQDLFKSFNSLQAGHPSRSFTSQPAAQSTTTVPANIYRINPSATISNATPSVLHTNDKYAALAELDDLFKVNSSNTGPSQPSVTTNTTTFSSAPRPPFPQWSSPSALVASAPAFNFAFPTPATAPTGNPFLPGSYRPPVHGALNPFENKATAANACATTVAPTSAFVFPNPITGLSNSSGPHNPFFSAPTVAAATTTAVEPMPNAYALSSTVANQGKPGPPVPPGCNTLASQSWIPAGVAAAPNPAFFLPPPPPPPPANNNTVVGSTWTNGTPNAGGSNVFF